MNEFHVVKAKMILFVIYLKLKCYQYCYKTFAFKYSYHFLVLFLELIKHKQMPRIVTFFHKYVFIKLKGRG